MSRSACSTWICALLSHKDSPSGEQRAAGAQPWPGAVRIHNLQQTLDGQAYYARIASQDGRYTIQAVKLPGLPQSLHPDGEWTSLELALAAAAELARAYRHQRRED